jgi:ketol-acid reductoisomerase
MKRILEDIQSGKFTKEFIADRSAQGAHNLEKIRERESKHPIESVGARLRKLMPWIAKNKLVKGEEAA